MKLEELKALLAKADDPRTLDWSAEEAEAGMQLMLHVPALIECAQAIEDYLKWGVMTGSDRALFMDRFTASIAKLEAVK